MLLDISGQFGVKNGVKLYIISNSRLTLQCSRMIVKTTTETVYLLEYGSNNNKIFIVYFTPKLTHG